VENNGKQEGGRVDGMERERDRKGGRETERESARAHARDGERGAGRARAGRGEWSDLRSTFSRSAPSASREGETKSLQRNMAGRSDYAMMEESTNSGIAGMEYVLRMCETLAGRVTALEEVRHLRP
jgi:hypothetical protein